MREGQAGRAAPSCAWGPDITSAGQRRPCFRRSFTSAHQDGSTANRLYGNWVHPADDPAAFVALVEKINAEGEPGQFAKTRYRYLTIADYTYWVSRSFYPRYGLIVNHKRADAGQGDGLNFAQDWNEGLTYD